MDPFVLAWDGGMPPPTLQFSGFTWIKKHGGPRGPGGNWFSDYNTWSDDEGLHLRTTTDGTHWWCAEVLLDHSLGYGQYIFQLTSRVDSLDPHATFAGFVYDSTNREIDFEFTRALGMPPGNNAQYVVQPYYTPGNRYTYLTTPEANTSHRLLWSSDSIVFTSWSGFDSIPNPDEIIQTWTYTGEDDPVPRGRERMRFNLWLDGAQAQHGDEVVVRSFQFLSLIPPTDVTILVVDHDIQLRWLGNGSLNYRVYSDTHADGSFETLVGTTTATSYTIPNGDVTAIQFYRVVGSSTP